jgi:hypothetical protein
MMPMMGAGQMPGGPDVLAMPEGMEKEEEVVLANLRHNYGVVTYMQAFVFVIGGLVTGVLGAWGWWGLVGYVLTHVLCLGAVWLKAGGNVRSALNLPTASFLRFGLLDQLVPFVFFWALAYTMVHVY